MIKIPAIKRAGTLLFTLASCMVASAATFEVDGISYEVISQENKTVKVVAVGEEVTGALDIPSKVTNEENEYAVLSVGDKAFYGRAITALTLPEGLVEIGDSVCCENTSLTTLNLPNTLKTVGEFAFFGCNQLTGFKIPENVEVVKDYGFAYCWGITELDLPEGVREIGEGAFANSSIKKIVLPESVTKLGKGVFMYCRELEEISIPSTLKVVSNGLFAFCQTLQEVVIPEGVEEIEESAFASCVKLSKVTLPSTLVKMGINVFMGSSLEHVTIPSGLTEIPDFTFSLNTSLKSVEIPAGVTSIGSYAFQGDWQLEGIEFPEALETIGNEAFKACSGLKEIVVPNKVTTIGHECFRAVGATEITLGSSVEWVGDNEFLRCFDLTDLTSLNEEPPVLGATPFEENAYATVTLHVPDSAIEAYKSAPYWKDFATIVGIGTGVEAVEEEAAAEGVWYNLTGMPVENPGSGIYIRNGKKVVVR